MRICKIVDCEKMGKSTNRTGQECMYGTYVRIRKNFPEVLANRQNNFNPVPMQRVQLGQQTDKQLAAHRLGWYTEEGRKEKKPFYKTEPQKEKCEKKVLLWYFLSFFLSGPLMYVSLALVAPGPPTSVSIRSDEYFRGLSSTSFRWIGGANHKLC